jgi:hypothetical protein
MAPVQADRLTRIGAALLRAADASVEEADAVAVADCKLATELDLK